MENIDLSQTVGTGISTMLTAGGILLLSAFIVMIVVIIKRWHGRFVPMLLGILTYAILVFIFTNLIMSALILIPTFDSAFTNNPTVYSIMYTLISAIGFTIARLVLANMMRERYERQGDVMLGGIGLGIGDALLFGSSIMMYVVYATAINGMGLEGVLAEMTAEEAPSIYQQYIEPLFSTPAPVWLIYGIGAVLDVVLCILIMMVVYGAVTGKIPGVWIFVSGIVQFVVAIPLQIADMSDLTNVLIMFLIKLVLFAAAAWYVNKVLASQITYSED